jgi:hypothetical protein
MYPKMLFDKGDPREAYALAEDADQDQALRARGFLPLDESGMHPDQFRDDVKQERHAHELQGTEAFHPSAIPAKRGRPRKE